MSPETVLTIGSRALEITLLLAAPLLLVALVTGLIANSQDNEFARRCGGTTDCDASLRPLGRRVERLPPARRTLAARRIVPKS